MTVDELMWRTASGETPQEIIKKMSLIRDDLKSITKNEPTTADFCNTISGELITKEINDKTNCYVNAARGDAKSHIRLQYLERKVYDERAKKQEEYDKLHNFIDERMVTVIVPSICCNCRFQLEYRDPITGRCYRSEFDHQDEEPRCREVLIKRIINDINKQKEKEKTVRDVWETLSKEQKDVVYFMIGQALENKDKDDNGGNIMPTKNYNEFEFVPVPNRRDVCCKPPKIAKIEVYNERVVKVTFADGTFTKAVCAENDIFDVDVGITICVMKKMLGKNGNKLYNNMIRDAHKLMTEQENEKIKAQMLKEEARKKQKAEEMKRKAKKLKAKEEQIDITKQGFIRAMQETGMVNDGR